MKRAPQLTAVRHTIRDALNRLADHIRPIALAAFALLTLSFLAPAAHAQALTVVSVNFYNSEADARADTDAITTATNSDTVYVRVVFSRLMKNQNGATGQSPRINESYTDRDNMLINSAIQIVAWDADFLAERSQCQAIARPPQTTYICQLALDSTEHAASPLAIFIKADGNTVTAKTITSTDERQLDADYTSPNSLTLTALAPQNPPTGVTLVAGNRQIDVSWTAVAAANDGGSPITGYIATATDINDSNNIFTCTATATTCLITGLTNGTQYRVTVLATNGVGNGPTSTSLASAIPATTPTAAPTGVTLLAADTVIIVSWNLVANTDSGGSFINGYIATATEVGNDANTFPCNTNFLTSTCDITGLSNGTEYRVTVLATNSVGNGPASAPLTATPMAATVPTVAPAGVTLVAADTAIIVSWNVVARTDNGGSDITGYIATATDTTDNNNTFTCETNRNNRIICIITGLTNGTEYRVTVQAINNVGNGLASAALTATPRPAPTDTPQAQTVAADFAFKPAAIAAGGSFRLLFVTTETFTALSSDISIYNAHVQTSAGGGHSAIQPFSGEFRALVSSSVVEARDNTVTNHVKDPSDPDAPIYWLNGDKVADDYMNFYDGEWDSVAGRDRSGNSYSFTESIEILQFIWTGSNSDGTKHSSGFFIGTDAPANGRLRATEEIDQTQFANTVPLPLYALSPILRVGNNVATLSALSVTLDDASTLTLTRSDGSTTGFDTAERTYTATAPSGTIMVTMAATVADSNASVQYAVGDPASALFTDSGVLTVADGNNTLTARVTAEDDVTTQDYTITLTVQANTDATLSALSVTPAGGSALTLTRSDGNTGFDTAERTYTATVLSAVDTVTVSATATDTSASIQYAVGDPASASFTNSGVLTVAGGESTLIARVTAEDGSTIQDYMITLTAPANTDATLNALSVTPVGDSSLTLTRPDGITMGFDTDELTYTATAPFGTTMVTVAAMATDSNASVQYAVGDPASASFTNSGVLTVAGGESTLTASVTAEDGTTTRDYIITLTVPEMPNSNANLSALSVTPIDGSELILMQSNGNTGFDTNELTYTATAPFGTTMVTVAAMATDSNASVQYAVGNPASAMFTGNGLLTVDSGESTLTVSVTAEDGTTTRDYIIILTVPAMPNTDASLSALSVRPVGGSELTLTQSDGNTTGFDTANSTYTATASNETTITVTVAATATDSRASVQYAVGANPANNAFNSSGDLTVDTGENILTVRVTAEDDVTTRDYTITLTLTVTEGLLFKIKVFLEGAQ